MKRPHLKEQILSALQEFSRPVLTGLLVLGLGVAMIYKRPAHALSNRGKKVVGVLVGGGAGGGLAAGLGSAKWFPLGFGLGGLAGGLIARQAIKAHKRNKERRQNQTQYRSKRSSRRTEAINPDAQELNQPTYTPRRHIRTNGNY
jgi:predicted lipid-binding transport protein (Tim44 family)